MDSGIIYVTTTIVPGVVKIGQTGSDNFEKRMGQLEGTGYANVTGLKRYYAIEVDEYKSKEKLLHDVFSHSRIGNTELFAVEADLVVQLLSSFEGKQIYPVTETKEESFEIAADQRGTKLIPDGTYYLNRQVERWENRTVSGTMLVEDGRLTVLSGSVLCPVKGIGYSVLTAERMRSEAVVQDNTLMNDVTATSPSAASAFLLYANSNGWSDWRSEDGQPIDVFRKDRVQDE